jgi:uncharacterized protein (DUF2267 family)
MRPYYHGDNAWPDYEKEEQWREQPLHHNTKKTMNFEAYASEGNHFVNDVARRLQTDRNTAARVTRAVLHALRDRLEPVDAVQFAQGLPMALKGVYFDRYNLSAVPVKIRHADNFLDFIYSKYGEAAITDFPTRQTVAEALQAVFYVLERNMDFGQVNQVKEMLPAEIVQVIEDYVL